MAESLDLYLDEDVDVLLAVLLNARGFNCVSAVELGHFAWTDEQHLKYAALEHRILVTHNRVDFQRLATEWWRADKTHSGIILAMRRPNSSELLRRILPVLARYDQAGWRNVTMYA